MRVFTKWPIWFLAVMMACTPKISDDTVEQQVTERLTGESVDLGFMGRIEFDSYFRVEEIQVKDRKINGDEATVICQVILIAKEDVVPSSIAASALEAFTEGKQVKKGQIVSTERKFIFDKFESGDWRLRD